MNKDYKYGLKRKLTMLSQLSAWGKDTQARVKRKCKRMANTSVDRQDYKESKLNE